MFREVSALPKRQVDKTKDTSRYEIGKKEISIKWEAIDRC